MKTWFQSRRFFLQILSLTISLLLLLSVVFSVILYNSTQRSTDAAIHLSETDRAQELLRQSTNSWRQLIASASAFATMTLPAGRVPGVEDMAARNLLSGMIKSYSAANSYTSNIDLLIGDSSFSPTVVSHDRFLGSFYFFDIFTQDEASWPYSFDLETNYASTFNKVVITVDAAKLSEYLFTADELDRMDFLLLSDGTILLSNQENALFKNIRDILPSLPLEGAVNSASLHTYGDYYYLMTAQDNFGFRILTLCPKAIYSGQYANSYRHTAIMSVALLVVAVAISLFLALFFYRPVKKTMDLLQTYVPQEVHDYENEIQFIHQNIEKYVDKPKTDVGLPDTFSKLQTAQAAVLQHQINSHFLFNTLENIKAISVTELGADNEIENSIMLLNSIIREGISQKKLLVPLSHELHLTGCYLELMQLRFPDVAVEWDLDESLKQCQVFRFSLQPILENCFSHAFKGNLHRQKIIYVKVGQVENDLSVVIRDNGLGIEPGAVAQLIHSLSAPEDADGPKHVGVRNIHQRITDTFGQKYGIRISDAAPGLIVELRYPILSDPLS